MILEVIYVAFLYFLMVLILGGLPVSQSRIQVLDESGAPFPNVLVIVKSLEGQGEIGRYLTDRSGQVPSIRFEPGIYRLIATCPYGPCKTTVREILGSDLSPETILKIPMNPTDTNGMLLNAPKIHLALRRPANDVVTKNVKLLVRDPEAKSEKWYTADAKGGVDVELPSDPATVVAIANGRIITWTLASTCKHGEPRLMRVVLKSFRLNRLHCC